MSSIEMPNIKELAKKREYSFLQTEDRLRDGLVFLVVSGSHGYGTATYESDVDIRGVCFNSMQDLLGFGDFEQFVDVATDTVIYSFNKFAKLACDCNPNIIEMLGCGLECYEVNNDCFYKIYENRHLFLSKRAIKAFGGYATQQLRRLQNALARGTYPQDEKERHIMESVKNAITQFNGRYSPFPEGSIGVYLSKPAKAGLPVEIYTDVSLSGYPLRDFKNILADCQNIVKDYDKLNTRNKKKDDLHLNKHAMHLVRLYMMCIDILENRQINTRQASGLDLLVDIRNGAFQKEDGTFSKEFFKLVDDYESKMAMAAKSTLLPDNPDMAAIEKLVVEVNRAGLGL